MYTNETHQSNSGFFSKIKKFQNPSGIFFAGIIITALIAFESFNYSTTDFALRDLLGDLRFLGMHWATILTIAFCGIDFAGIARLFAPEQGENETKEVWYLFGAWLLAATMNAALTWWGVSMAISTHELKSAAVIDPQLLYQIVPVFVALMVWVIRILIIGSLSVAGDRVFAVKRPIIQPRSQPQVYQSANQNSKGASTSMNTGTRPSSNHKGRSTIEPRPLINRPEPTYQSMNTKSSHNQTTTQRKF
jgi:hypothetical protein